MSGPIQIIGEALPYAGAIAGFAAGAALDQKIAHQNLQEANVWANSADGSRAIEPQQKGLFNKIRAKIGPVAVTAAAAVGAAGIAWSYDYEEPKNNTETVKIVADRSGASAVEDSGMPADAITESVITLVDQLHGDVNLFTASAGEVQTPDADEIAQVPPQGTARIGTALRQATKETVQQGTKKNQEKSQIVVVVNGEKKLPDINEKQNIVSVINVGDTSKYLQDYAKDMGGTYTGVDNKENAADLAGAVAKTINPESKAGKVEFKFSAAERALMTGLAGLAIFGAISSARRNKTYGSSKSGKVTQIGGQ